jgi:hypothetical protein
MPFGGSQGVKIKLNRLSLTALFDRNNSWFSIAFDVWLAAMVTLLASMLIARGVFMDFSLFIFAFVIASSQFSLLKSVQPDAASPVHGFNWYHLWVIVIQIYFQASLLLPSNLFLHPRIGDISIRSKAE